jgi:hypothetical protein
MLDDGDAEILHIKFSFSASPGYHNIWVGLRASASACITGTGSAVTMGQVEKITIDGIAAPDAPDVTGPTTGLVGETYEFCAESHDPNGDKVKYYFNWDDDSNSGWTEYKPSGTKVCKTHEYSSEGTYTITVYTQDIDQMQSETTYTINVGEQNPPSKPILSGSSTSSAYEDYTLKIQSTDPNGDDVKYLVEWGDEETDEYGPYNSGDEKSISHIYYYEGTYTIRAKATDEISGWSDWATLQVTMPRNKTLQNIELFQFLNKFPLFTKILNYV